MQPFLCNESTDEKQQGTIRIEAEASSQLRRLFESRAKYVKVHTVRYVVEALTIPDDRRKVVHYRWADKRNRVCPGEHEPCGNSVGQCQNPSKRRTKRNYSNVLGDDETLAVPLRQRGSDQASHIDTVVHMDCVGLSNEAREAKQRRQSPKRVREPSHPLDDIERVHWFKAETGPLWGQISVAGAPGDRGVVGVVDTPCELLCHFFDTAAVRGVEVSDEKNLQAHPPM
jgi:hypothetical protein